MTNTADETRTLTIEKTFPHAPEKLWRALTESPLIAQWLMENDFAPEPGRRFQFRAPPAPQWDGIIDCEVLIVEPLKQLAYTWGTLGLDTTVTFTLTPADGGTHLRMQQTGFGPGREANYSGAKWGWNKFLGALDTVAAGLD